MSNLEKFISHKIAQAERAYFSKDFASAKASSYQANMLAKKHNIKDLKSVEEWFGGFSVDLCMEREVA